MLPLKNVSLHWIICSWMCWWDCTMSVTSQTNTKFTGIFPYSRGTFTRQALGSYNNHNPTITAWSTKLGDDLSNSRPSKSPLCGVCVTSRITQWLYSPANAKFKTCFQVLSINAWNVDNQPLSRSNTISSCAFVLYGNTIIFFPDSRALLLGLLSLHDTSPLPQIRLQDRRCWHGWGSFPTNSTWEFAMLISMWLDYAFLVKAEGQTTGFDAEVHSKPYGFLVQTINRWIAIGSCKSYLHTSNRLSMEFDDILSQQKCAICCGKSQKYAITVLARHGCILMLNHLAPWKTGTALKIPTKS